MRTDTRGQTPRLYLSGSSDNFQICNSAAEFRSRRCILTPSDGLVDPPFSRYALIVEVACVPWKSTLFRVSCLIWLTIYCWRLECLSMKCITEYIWMYSVIDLKQGVGTSRGRCTISQDHPGSQYASRGWLRGHTDENNWLHTDMLSDPLPRNCESM